MWGDVRIGIMKSVSEDRIKRCPLIQWTWVWANSEKRWRLRKSGVLHPWGHKEWIGSSDWTTQRPAPPVSLEHIVPHSPPWTPFRAGQRSVAEAAQDSISAQANDKCPWQVPICSGQNHINISHKNETKLSSTYLYLCQHEILTSPDVRGAETASAN